MASDAGKSTPPQAAVRAAAGADASRVAHVPADWSVWAFSDPHGVMSGLTVALREAGIVDQDLHWSAPAGTALVGCGDYLDRGADSRGVVALLRRLQGEAAAAGGVAVLARGNHEHLLHGLITGAASDFDTWLQYGGEATLQSYGIRGLDPADRRGSVAAIEGEAPGITRWMETLPHAIRWRDILFVHGGLVPGTGLDDLGRTTFRHLTIRGDFFDTPWRSGAFAAYEAAGIERVVFGHTPQARGIRSAHDGRSLAIDTNACGNPGMAADASRMISLVRLAGDLALEDAPLVVVPTEGAPDRSRD